jgi:uncharacterized membrane protein
MNWIVAVVSRHERASRSTTAVRPEELLDRRLANGEIDAATYGLPANLRAAT